MYLIVLSIFPPNISFHFRFNTQKLKIACFVLINTKSSGSASILFAFTLAVVKHDFFIRILKEKFVQPILNTYENN